MSAAEPKPTTVTVRKARGGFIVTWRVYSLEAHPLSMAMAQQAGPPRYEDREALCFKAEDLSALLVDLFGAAP